MRTTQIFSSHLMTLTSCLKKMNEELTNRTNWFNAIKLLINVNKTKDYFFLKIIKIQNIQMRILKHKINGLSEHESLIKFLEVWIDENLTCRDHIHTVKNKIRKDIGLFYQWKHYVDEHCLKQIYFLTYKLI